MNHEVGLCRNDDSSTLPSGFYCCKIGLGVRVFTQPRPETATREAAASHWSLAILQPIYAWLMAQQSELTHPNLSRTPPHTANYSERLGSDRGPDPVLMHFSW
jgi:hypothetical protein